MKTKASLEFNLNKGTRKSSKSTPTTEKLGKMQACC